MLDYYGCIMMNEDDITNNLTQTPKYVKYSKKYITDVINDLYMSKILSDSYSISGWHSFHKRGATNHIDKYIELDTLLSKKKLALMLQLTNSTDLVFEIDLHKKICDNIKKD